MFLTDQNGNIPPETGKRSEREVALTFNIQRFSIQDGPGIRTTVFLKGCPLSCKWCSNPESQNSCQELMYRGQKCQGCGSCVQECPEEAVQLVDGRSVIDRAKCTLCFDCVDVCCSGALEISGQTRTLDEIFDEVCRDELFYKNSGGGVTVSGGEPLLQSDFVLQFFKRCREKSLDTTLDTSGFAKWEEIEKILPYTDRILYDLKHLDPDRHLQGTGVKNDLILDNLLRIVNTESAGVWIRIPVIPGYNDSERHVSEMALFLRDLKIEKVSLLGFHKWGTPKYEFLGRKPAWEGEKSPDESHLERLKKIMESKGLNVTIGY